MIILEENNTLTAIQHIFCALYQTVTKPSDNELLKESTLTLELNDPEPPIRIQIVDNKLVSHHDYSQYFIDSQRLLELECEYWTNEFFNKDRLHSVINYLRKYPDSKRAILLLWEDGQRDLSKNAACMTYAYFRKKFDAITLNVHMRANNAYNCIYIDIDSLRAVHKFVADSLNLKMGPYIHFVDSLHFYAKDEMLINNAYFSYEHRNINQ